MQRPKGENYADDLLQNVCDFCLISHGRLFKQCSAAHSVAAKYCHKQTRDVVSKVLPYNAQTNIQSRPLS